MVEHARERTAMIVRSLEKHLAHDIRVIDVEDVTSLGDSFVIAHGASTTQVRALADYVEKELEEQGIRPLRVEGYSSSKWILMDYGDVIVHLFHSDTRSFYDLERLWKDGKEVELEEFVQSEETAS